MSGRELRINEKRSYTYTHKHSANNLKIQQKTTHKKYNNKKINLFKKNNFQTLIKKKHKALLIDDIKLYLNIRVHRF